MRRTADETRATILEAARRRSRRPRLRPDHHPRRRRGRRGRPGAGDAPLRLKDGLFAEAAEVDLRLPPAAKLPRAQVGELLAGHFFDRWDGDPALVILLRTGVTRQAVAERLREIFAKQLVPIARRLGASRREAPVRAALVGSQVLGMALCRYILVLPPLAAMDRDALVAWLGPTLQRYLVGG